MSTGNDNNNNNNNEQPIVAKKRGRKSKKELELAAAQKENALQNITVQIEESPTSKECITSNIDFLNLPDENNIIKDANHNENENENQNDELDADKPVAKKRGRKPKGGKIIQQVVSLNNNKESKPNIILHLKCSLKDLLTFTGNDNSIQSYNFQNVNNLTFDIINPEANTFNSNQVAIKSAQHKYTDDNEDDETDDELYKESDIREVWKKLKQLEHNLHINNICDKKSACFWCTYDFDNPPVYIPKHFIKETYHVYGCFCSPECATAYLMDENIDSSAKFERYHLINHIYSKIYDYKKNIKPAPNPYYMLEKYYGNLNIQEYRSLLRNERLFLIVDKPLTRILPELHEDNDDFIINNKIIPSNTYQIKKKLQKKQTKNNILSERFGLTQ
jgi:hypothetical protein